MFMLHNSQWPDPCSIRMHRHAQETIHGSKPLVHALLSTPCRELKSRFCSPRFEISSHNDQRLRGVSGPEVFAITLKHLQLQMHIFTLHHFNVEFSAVQCLAPTSSTASCHDSENDPGVAIALPLSLRALAREGRVQSQDPLHVRGLSYVKKHVIGNPSRRKTEAMRSLS